MNFFHSKHLINSKEKEVFENKYLQILTSHHTPLLNLNKL